MIFQTNLKTNKTNPASLDIVGIGNAIVDVLTTTDDSLLGKLSLDCLLYTSDAADE